MADRNSASPIHCFSTTSTSRDQAARPPPKEASAMWLNVHASSRSETLSSGVSISLMHEVWVVREVVLDVLGRIEGIRSLVMVGKLPVAVEDLFQPPDCFRIRYRDAHFPPQIESAPVDIHRPHQCVYVVHDNQLRVNPQILLFVYFDAEVSQAAQRCERVE